MPKWIRAVIFLAGATVTCIFFINFCSAIFNCGCTWLWAGAGDHCNVHTGPKHCPWCTMGQSGQYGLLAGMLLPQAWVSFYSGWSFVPRLAGTLLAFPGAGLVFALIAGLWQGYWN